MFIYIHTYIHIYDTHIQVNVLMYLDIVQVNYVSNLIPPRKFGILLNVKRERERERECDDGHNSV